MKFQVGDWVYINPKYFVNHVATERGVITDKTAPHAPEYHIIDWEDGHPGWTVLNPKTDYLLKV